MDYGYPVEALRQEGESGLWYLDAGFDADWMMWHIETAEDARDLAQESWAVLEAKVEGRRDPLPLARLRDAQGAVRAEGVLSGDVPLILQRSGARPIRLDRMEIDGVLALFVPSEALEPGQRYIEEIAEVSPRSETAPELLNDHGFLGTGAMIATNEGPQPIDWLRAGDLILTRDNGYQPILHLAHLTLPRALPADQRPRVIRGETFGDGLPARDLLATGGTQILLAAPQLELWFGEAEMFARLDRIAPDLGPAPLGGVQSLWSLVLPEPEVILAEGLWVGSALATPEFVSLLPARAAKLLAPMLSKSHRQSARACLADWEAAMFTRQIEITARVAA